MCDYSSQRCHFGWTRQEDARLRSLQGKGVKAILHLFPGRGRSSICVRRNRLGLVKTPRRFTPAEIALFRRNVDCPDWSRLKELFPGRARSSLWALAKRLGLPATNRRRKPVSWGNPICDEIRMRAWEDGISLRALDREIEANGYFHQSGARPRLARPFNRQYALLALEFFDARLRRDGTIDWMDE